VLKLRICFLFYLNFVLIANENFFATRRVYSTLNQKNAIFSWRVQGASSKSGQISISISLHIVPPPNVTLGDWISLILLVNNHKLKMAAASTPGREYNRRATIIEGLRTERSPTEIIGFFWYPRSTVYDVVAKYSASEQSNESSSTPARKSHSKERTARTPVVVERTQALISEDPGQSLSKISINCRCKRVNNASNCRGRSSIQIIH